MCSAPSDLLVRPPQDDFLRCAIARTRAHPQPTRAAIADSPALDAAVTNEACSWLRGAGRELERLSSAPKSDLLAVFVAFAGPQVVHADHRWAGCRQHSPEPGRALFFIADSQQPASEQRNHTERSRLQYSPESTQSDQISRLRSSSMWLGIRPARSRSVLMACVGFGVVEGPSEGL